MPRIPLSRRLSVLRLIPVLAGSFLIMVVAYRLVGDTLQVERDVLVALQSVDGSIFGIGLPDIARAFTRLGDWEVMTSVAVLVVIAQALSRQTRTAVAAAGGYLATPVIVWLFKGITGRPRPIADLYAGSGFDAFSMPSGHSANSLVILGFLFFLLARGTSPRTRTVLAICGAFLIAMVGISRIYLGAHWPTDVLAGWLVGATVLCAMIAVCLMAPRTKATDRFAIGAGVLTALIWVGALIFHGQSPEYGPIEESPEFDMREVPAEG